jgi:tetrahydromethanopterin S-methyltransferase subunit G
VRWFLLRRRKPEDEHRDAQKVEEIERRVDRVEAEVRALQASRLQGRRTWGQPC